MERTLLAFFLCLLPAAKACECATTYGLECVEKETICSNGLIPIYNPKCFCCRTCPKVEFEECGGPYYSKGQCNAADNGKVPKLYCSAWGTHTTIDELAILGNGSDIVGICVQKVCIKVCSARTPASGRVCGDDGIEYKSKCHMRQKNNCYIDDPSEKVKTTDKSNCPCFGIRCEGIGEQCSNGQCVCKDEAHCENLYEPVCGSNGLLYQSECHANFAICNASREAKFTISNQTCGELERCRNQCTGQGEICDIKSGQFVGCVCQSSSNCPSNDLSAFCASNGHTFTSRCHMDAYACKLKQEVTFKHAGSCSSDPGSSGLSSSPEYN